MWEKNNYLPLPNTGIWPDQGSNLEIYDVFGHAPDKWATVGQGNMNIILWTIYILIKFKDKKCKMQLLINQKLST